MNGIHEIDENIEYVMSALYNKIIDFHATEYQFLL